MSKNDIITIPQLMLLDGRHVTTVLGSASHKGRRHSARKTPRSARKSRLTRDQTSVSQISSNQVLVFIMAIYRSRFICNFQAGLFGIRGWKVRNLTGTCLSLCHLLSNLVKIITRTTFKHDNLAMGKYSELLTCVRQHAG